MSGNPLIKSDPRKRKSLLQAIIVDLNFSRMPHAKLSVDAISAI